MAQLAHESKTSLPRSWPAFLAILFFCSGFLALNYEVLWQRRFSLVFGSGAPATAAVLAAYFAGLGLGSVILGNAARKWRPLRTYAVLEAFIGLGALLVEPILLGVEKLHPWLWIQFSFSPSLFFTVKTSLAFVALALPTFCMGGTLPVLGQLIDCGRRRLGATAGLLYVANTFGAAAGCLAVPFFLLQSFGSRGTLWLCVTINLILAVIAWWTDGIACKTTPIIDARKTEIVGTTPPFKDPALLLSLISGFAAFALQVLWNRAFAQIHENSVYSFAAIVAVFVAALAVGAQLARLGLRRDLAPQSLIAFSWIVSGALVMAAPWAFLRLTNELSYLPSNGGWSRYALHLLGLVSAIIFAPIALLGVGLPAVMERAGARASDNASCVLGRLLGVNVIGSVAGAMMGGFVFPQQFGFWKSIFLTGAGVSLTGVLVLNRTKRSRLATPSIAIILFLIVGLVSSWRAEWPRVRVAESQGERLVALKESAHGVVAVVERLNSRRLKLNNHYVLGGTSSTGDERMQAHIPLLLHPAPRDVAFLGLGTGITASGALFHPLRHATVVELVPEVIDVARQYFGESNARVMEASQIRVVAEDARNYLRSVRERFDVIVGDLVVPWRQGEGALFTREQFAAARFALAPGGLFCQWLPLFQLSETELQILVRTFVTVFPRAYVWRGDFSPDEPAIALIGARDGWNLKTSDVRRRIGEMKTDPSNPQLADPNLFWMHLAGFVEQGDLSGNETRINDENFPWIELLGPLRHAGNSREALLTGRRLQSWLSDVKARSMHRIDGWSASEMTGSRTGDLLFEYSLSLSEKKPQAAAAVQAQIKALLPESSYRLLFP